MTFALKTIVANCILVFVIHNFLSAQKVFIKGSIITDSAKAIQNCYIKIVSKKEQRILSYFAAGKENSFSAELPFSGPDSLFISASHIGYHSNTLPVYVSRPDTFSVSLVMTQAPDTLNGVNIKAPQVWVNGDTTFFNANSFKQGDEHKLKDLITQMPGFEIDKQGNLLYKKQAVDKIMIDGEEVFADKVKLMLDNFPVYVIKNVEVIKNQTDDPLLKGLLNENKLFVNLSLTRNAKLKAAFGDGEAGVGTLNKYFINPVIFSLYGKLKLGYIGNWNNIGNGIGWKEQDELKSAPIRSTEQWMMESNQLQIVNDLENRRYISNGQSDNRFQINMPFTKKIKSTTEVDFIEDKQRQLEYNSSSLFNGTEYIDQTDTSQIRNNPYSLLLRQNLAWNINGTKNITGQFSFYHNGSNSTSNIRYNQTGTLNNSKNTISDSWDSYLFSLSYTNRISSNRAVKWFADLSDHQYPQTVNNFSEIWSSVFQVPEAYDLMVQDLVNKTRMATLGWTSVSKTKKGIIETGILLNTLSTSITTDILLSNLKDTTPIYPEGYTLRGDYRTSSIVGYTRKLVHLFKIPFFVKGEYGLGATSKAEDSSLYHNQLLYSLEFNNESHLGKHITAKLDASFSQHQLEANKLHGILLPNFTNSFHNNLNVGTPLRTLRSSYILSYSWKPQIGFALYTAYNTEFTGFSSINRLNQFIQINSDSLTRRPLNNYIIHLNTNIYSFKSNFHGSVDFGYNVSQRFVYDQSKLFRNDMILFYINTGFSTSWEKTYFISMEANYSNVGFKLPPELQTQVAKNVSDIKATLSQRVVVSKSSNIVFDMDFFDKNIFTPYQLSFFMLDAAYNFSVPESSWSFSLRLQNITNQTKYTTIDNSALSQNFFTIPLIKRNVFVSARYEL